MPGNRRPLAKRGIKTNKQECPSDVHVSALQVTAKTRAHSRTNYSMVQIVRDTFKLMDS